MSSLIRFRLRSFLAVAACGLGLMTAASAEMPALLDDFTSPEATSFGTPRLLVTDAGIGGQSQATLTWADDCLRVTGELKPARGQPGFVSYVLLLTPDATAADLSAYTGIRLKVRVLQGNLQVLAASSAVTNFDYHAAPLRRTGELTEVRIPFADLARVWSPPMALDLTTITSINLVAAGGQAGSFRYEIAEVGFYGPDTPDA